MPDAILLDGHMPTMGDGRVPVLAARAAERQQAVVIYCTTENDSTEIARALTAGADDYVLKPFDREGSRAKLAAAGHQALTHSPARCCRRSAAQGSVCGRRRRPGRQRDAGEDQHEADDVVEPELLAQEQWWRASR